MPVTQLPLIKGDKVGSETDWRDQLSVNMSAIIKPIFGADGYMLQQPGLTQYATGQGIDRGGIWNERFSDHYRVSGDKLISVDADGVVESLGTIPGTGTASLPYSFNTQGVIADGRFFLYSADTGFSEVTDPDLGNPIDGVWVDGYYFMTDGDFLFHTDIDDESSIDPLKFATAEFMPDKSLGVGKTADNKVLVFGRYTIEYFVNDASENFSFQRLPTRAAKLGIVGTHCKVEAGNNWYLLGGRKEESIGIYAYSLGESAKVSSREIDKIIGSYTETELSTSVLETREEDGYRYIIAHLPSHTLLFNETAVSKVGIDQAWSILKTDVLGDAEWRGKHGVFEPRKGEWVYGDKIDGTIGVLDNTVATHYGEIAEWLLYTPFFPIESASIDELEIQTIPGFTDFNDATVFLSMTYNGVKYGKEWTKEYGAQNDYNQRFIIRRLGYVREFFSIKLRGATKSRMAFAAARIKYG